MTICTRTVHHCCSPRRIEHLTIVGVAREITLVEILTPRGQRRCLLVHWLIGVNERFSTFTGNGAKLCTHLTMSPSSRAYRLKKKRTLSELIFWPQKNLTSSSRVSKYSYHKATFRDKSVMHSDEGKITAEQPHPKSQEYNTYAQYVKGRVRKHFI